MAALQEAAAQVPVVVDLSVEDDHLRAVFVEDRLPAPAHVDDAEAPHPQPDRSGHVESLVVRATLPQGGTHPTHQRLGHGTIPVAIHDASNAAHIALFESKSVATDDEALAQHI